MLTRTELEKLMSQYYTPEELCDMLEIESSDLVEYFADRIEDNIVELSARVEEDIGHEGTDETD